MFEKLHRVLGRIPFRYKALFTIQTFVTFGILFHRQQLIERQKEIVNKEIEDSIDK